MRTGTLRHDVLIQSRATTQSSTGEPAYSWTTVATRKASIEPLAMGSREFFAAQQFGAKNLVKITVRYFTGLDPSYRIVWDNRWFDIKSVQVFRWLKAWMVILAEELVGQAP